MASIARALGFRFFERDSRGRFELRMSWVEVTGGWGLAFGLMLFGDDNHFSLHIRFGWPNIYLRLPFLSRWSYEPAEMMDQWGFGFFERALHLHWGSRTKVIHLPWHYEWVRTSLLLKDGTWAHEMARPKRPGFPNYPVVDRKGLACSGYFAIKELMWSEVYPYRYTLRSGKVQERTATVKVEEREWRWRALWWFPFFAKVSRTIAVDFNDEVGERSGSWKGGTVGCSYSLLPQEMPQEALRRMERERKF